MLHVTPIPAFHDNYIWAIHEPEGQEVIIVDPGDAEPVIQFLQQQRLDLRAILITHSHHDHIGGINDLLKYHHVEVFGPDSAAIKQVTQTLTDNDTFTFWNTAFKVWHLPGHLPEHLGYIVEHHGHTQVFSGDIMFSSGCGRIFNGTPAELKGSLDRLQSLPGESLVYGSHEYTQSNLTFAHHVEPDNLDILKKIEHTQQLRDKGQPSLPTQMLIEQKTNPFLRCNHQPLINCLKKHTGTELLNENAVFKALREWKNNF